MRRRRARVLLGAVLVVAVVSAAAFMSRHTDASSRAAAPGGGFAGTCADVPFDSSRSASVSTIDPGDPRALRFAPEIASPLRQDVYDGAWLTLPIADLHRERVGESDTYSLWKIGEHQGLPIVVSHRVLSRLDDAKSSKADRLVMSVYGPGSDSTASVPYESWYSVRFAVVLSPRGRATFVSSGCRPYESERLAQYASDRSMTATDVIQSLAAGSSESRALANDFVRWEAEKYLAETPTTAPAAWEDRDPSARMFVRGLGD